MPLGLWVMTQSGMCGAAQPWGPHSPGQSPLLTWVPEHGIPAGQGNPAGAGALLGTSAEPRVPRWREQTLPDPALLGTDRAAARKMRDFQGQLCFTNPVIMPLKILIVLAIVNCGMGRPGRKARGQAALEKEAGRSGWVSGWGQWFCGSGTKGMWCCDPWCGACASYDAQGMRTGARRWGN